MKNKKKYDSEEIESLIRTKKEHELKIKKANRISNIFAAVGVPKSLQER